jgi:hypothetical protein
MPEMTYIGQEKQERRVEIYLRRFANYSYYGTDCDKIFLNGIVSKSLIKN